MTSLLIPYCFKVLEGINMCIVLLFASIINASAAMSFSREEKCIQIVKYIPVSIKLQLIAKTLIPLTGISNKYTKNIILNTLPIIEPSL